MRIWSIHPQYLDSKGLVALWRETLLAKNVLAGKTKGYKNHPQLNRFKATSAPLQSINRYLVGVYEEAVKRGYHFNDEKIDWHITDKDKIIVTQGQLDYEFKHLLNKLQHRQPSQFAMLKTVTDIQVHPLFSIIEGDVETWEII